MVDIEKVIRSIKGCVNDGSYCNKCDYDGCVFTHGSCEKDLLADALELLKKQRKTGEWYKQLSKNESAIAVGGSRTMSCSKCGGWGRKTFAFCPHCGARMTQ